MIFTKKQTPYLTPFLLLLYPSLASAGLISWFELDDPIGTTASPTVGGAGVFEGFFDEDFQIEGSPGDQGDDDFSVAIFGGGQRVVLGETGAPLVGLTRATVSLWVLLDGNGSDNALVATGPFASGTPFLLWRDESANIAANTQNTLTFIIGGTRFEGPSDLLNETNIWYHIAVSFDGTLAANPGDAVALYVDGVLIDPVISPGPNPIPATIGGDLAVAGESVPSIGRNLVGQLDEISVYDAVLTPEQVLALADGDSPASLVIAEPPAPEAPFEITSITRNEVDQSVVVFDASVEGATYTLLTSIDLDGFSEVAVDVSIVDGVGTFVDTVSATTDPVRFYQVFREEVEVVGVE